MKLPKNKEASELDADIAFKSKRLLQILWAVEISILTIVIYRLASGLDWVLSLFMLCFCLCLGVIYPLSKRGKSDLGAAILLTSLTFGLIYLMLAHDGLRDEAVLAFPGILVFAAILGSRLLFRVLFVIMLVAIYAIAKAYEIGLIERTFVTTDFDNVINLTVILSVVAFSIWLLASDLNRLLRRLSRENKRVRESQAEIQKLVHHDALTGLPNRVLARDRLDHAVANNSRKKNIVCMMFLDLDNFKNVNDTLGHQTGDQLLIDVSLRLQSILRTSDTVSRLGGDEFLLIIESIDDKEQITAIANKINETIARPFKVVDEEIITSCSIGIAVAPHDGSDFDTLLRHADMAMYHSKELGKNHFRFFDDDMNTHAQEHMKLISDLRRAIQEDQLVLHYQPKVDLDSGRIVGAEALMRWHHPSRGMIPPDVFIPLAESSGLIVEMGRWAINKACDDCFAWNDLGFPDISVAVNISPIQFKRGDIERLVQKALLRTQLTPWNLELEMTESLLIDDFKELKEVLVTLKRIGVSFSIDDFGTGYSNLGYLKQFNVDSLKIDQSFIQRIHENQQDVAIVGAIIQMAQNLSLKTIAEGIEEERTAKLLKEMGCDQAQGYFWSKPAVEEEFRRILLREKVKQVN